VAIMTVLMVWLYHTGTAPKIAPNSPPRTDKAQLEEPAKTPASISPPTTPATTPIRLLSATPTRVRLDKCPYHLCSFILFLRGYDSDAQVRYDHRELFADFKQGEERDNPYNTVEKMYIGAGEAIAFRLYCDMFQKPGGAKIGDYKELHWDKLNEELAV